MNTSRLRLLLVSASMAALPAAAIEPAKCIRLDGSRIENACNAKLNVSYCVDSRDSFWSCRRGGRWDMQGSKTLSPGRGERIPEYDGSDRVYWIACKYPDLPSGWSGPNSHYACR
jgi:hypothetical protein